MAVFSFVYGNPLRLINGYDSFGNTCGVRHNQKYSGFTMSGLDTSDKPNLFFLDIKELRQTLKICVRECPTRTIHNRQELYSYYKDTDSQLCRYDFNMTLLLSPNEQQRKPSTLSSAADTNYFDFLGPCPPFPVYESSPVLHRCIPSGKQAPGEQVRDMYDLVNSWSVTQQLFGDLYVTWPVIAIMCLCALREYTKPIKQRRHVLSTVLTGQT